MYVPRNFALFVLPFAGHAIRGTRYTRSVIFSLSVGVQVCTELITNNAAAALAVPIALSIAKELDVRQQQQNTKYQA